MARSAHALDYPSRVCNLAHVGGASLMENTQAKNQIEIALRAADTAMREVWGNQRVNEMNTVYSLEWQVRLAAGYLAGRNGL